MRKFEKKESKFMKYKELGNNCFSKKDYREAAILYNKALCHATSNLQLSLLYANRSAVYLEVKKFKECLENIQLAKNSGYPQEKMAKLIAREVNCKTKLLIHQNEEKLSKVEEAVKKFFKLSYKSHPTIPHIIDGIELRRSEEFGRHLITTRDLKAGDMIAIEEPFLKYLESGHVARFERCANCLRQNNFNLIPCNKCSEYMYCSESCMLELNPYHHSKETKPFYIGQVKAGYDVAKKIAVRSKQVFGQSSYLSALQECHDKTIFDFDELNEMNCLIALGCLYMKKGFEGLAKSNDKDELSAIYNKLDGIIQSTSIGYVSYAKAEEDDFKPAAFGVFLFGSLLNHSCDGNIRYTYYDDKNVYYADRPIKAGQQLFLTYKFNFYLLPYYPRRATIDFDCKCKACVENWPLMANLPNRIRNFDIQKVFADKNNGCIIERIKKFKKHCSYLDKIWHLHPCFETVFIAGDNLTQMTYIRKQII